ncbi:MAG: dihydropteroate synthase, partial [Edaphobacter sp.]
PLVLEGLAQRLEAATAAGIPRNKIVLDPGLGFGKKFDENYPLLAHFDQLRQLNLPLLVGVSRKSFLTRTLTSSLLSSFAEGGGPASSSTTRAPEDLINVSTAANVAAILAGAHIIRTHDVSPAVEAATIADRILAEI